VPAETLPLQKPSLHSKGVFYSDTTKNFHE